MPEYIIHGEPTLIQAIRPQTISETVLTKTPTSYGVTGAQEVNELLDKKWMLYIGKVNENVQYVKHVQVMLLVTSTLLTAFGDSISYIPLMLRRSLLLAYLSYDGSGQDNSSCAAQPTLILRCYLPTEQVSLPNSMVFFPFIFASPKEWVKKD